jgi:tripartite-type tricarboxylate transporter receptor subunit TctC
MPWSSLYAVLAVIGAAVPLAALSAQPVDFSKRTVRIIVPFAPGGSTDFVARIIQPRLAEELKTQVVIDNRAGAAGNIGVELAARSNPDGFTLLLGNIGTMAINPHLFPDFPYRPLKHFVPVTQIADVPGSLVVNPSLPVHSVTELIAYAKANPGKLNFASPGAGSANRIEMEMLMRAAGMQMTHIPFKGGAGPAVTSMIQNETQTGFVTMTASISFVKAGKLRLLAVVSPKRVPAFPDVPTMAEAGFKHKKTGSWLGILVPAGTPRPVVNALFEVLHRVMQHPEVTKRLGEIGTDVVLSKSPDDFAAFIRTESERYGKAIREAGIKAE